MAKQIRDENGNVYVQKKPFYKRWWFIALLVLVIAGFLAPKNGQNSTSTATSSSSTIETSSSAKTEISTSASSAAVSNKMGEVVTVGDVEYTVNTKETATNVGGQFGKNANGQFIILDVTVKNNGKKAITVTDGFFKLLQGEVEYESDSAASLYAQDGNSTKFFLNELNPGNAVTGKVVFDVSPETAGAGDLRLQVQTGVWGTQKGLIDLF